MYRPFMFEGELTPVRSDLYAVLTASQAKRAWLARACVVGEELAESVECELLSVLPGNAQVVSLSIVMGEALFSRALALFFAENALSYSDDVLRAPNYFRKDQSIGSGIACFIAAVAPRSNAVVKRFRQAAVARPDMGFGVWETLSEEEFVDAVVHLPRVLLEVPAQAEAMGSRLALMCTEEVFAVCEGMKDLPLEVRADFARGLERQLRRIFQIRRWVECRDTLFTTAERSEVVKIAAGQNPR